MYQALRSRAKKIKSSLPTPTYCLAFVWRRLLFRTTFVAITGSAGKTTAKNCVASIFHTKWSTISTLGSRNTIRDDLLPRTILRVRPWHRFAIIEIGVGKIGAMKKSANLVKPHVCLVLRVGANHLKEFKTLETVAHEKADLIRELNKRNTVILNGDDPLVLKMESETDAAVKTFGTSDRFHFRADNISSKWPERLSFDLHTVDGTYQVRTQFVGKHWLSSVLGAMSVADACGIPLEAAANAIRETEPYWGRIKPVTLPNGAVFIRDDWSGAVDSYEVAFEMLSEAKPQRKIIVSSSNLTDTKKKSKSQANYLGRNAAETVAMAVFVGEYAESARNNAVHFGMKEENAYGFPDWQPAADLLKKEIGKGDLIFIKGRTCDHLTRIYLSFVGDVKCQRNYCTKTTLCDHCPELGFKWTKDRSGLMAKPLNASQQQNRRHKGA